MWLPLLLFPDSKTLAKTSFSRVVKPPPPPPPPKKKICFSRHLALGVNIDRALNFSDHVSYICKKATQRVGVIRRLRILIPTSAKLQLHGAAILPYLTYCGIVWNFCKSCDSRKLEGIQERGLRSQGLYQGKSHFFKFREFCAKSGKL